MTAVLLGAYFLGFTEMRWSRVGVVIAGAVLAIHMPLLVAATGPIAAALYVVARRRRARARRVAAAAEVADLCDLAAVAVTGGLGLSLAVAVAAEHVGGEVGAEAMRLLRRARVDGLAMVMNSAEGVGRRLYRVIGQAAASGAAVLDPLVRLADELHAELAAKQLEAVRKLPVAMLFPLTMLILPGFLLLAVAPAILDIFNRLDL